MSLLAMSLGVSAWWDRERGQGEDSMAMSGLGGRKLLVGAG